MSTTTAETSTDTDNESKMISNMLKKHPPPDALPTGWLIRTSRSQPGSFFYYHQETGESRWEKPVDGQQQTKTASPSQATTAKPSNKASAPVPSNKHASPPSTAVEPPAKKAKKSDSSSPKEVRVLHILRKHKDSRRPASWRNPKVTSTLEESRAELQELVSVLQEVSADPAELRATFEELARTESDCSSAKRGGDLGFFGRKKMQPSFEAASFALGIGEMSPIIESSSGVHVILRIG